jgi:hypothetical protein
VRSSVAEGRITEEQLTHFSGLVRTTLGSKASFSLVSSVDEAALEHSSVEYCMQKMRGGTLGDEGEGSNRGVGLLSSGGMSSQVVWSVVSGGVRSLSLATKLKEGNARCLAEGHRAGLAAYGLFLEGVVGKAAEDTGTPLEGTFVVIEMLGGVGERVGIDRRFISARAALDALDVYIKNSMATADGQSKNEVAARDWKFVVGVTSALQAQHLIGLLDPNANLYFSRTFELGPGHLLKPSWTLGKYVNRLRLKEQ